MVPDFPLQEIKPQNHQHEEKKILADHDVPPFLLRPYIKLMAIRPL